eukprot:1464237-Pyramimonas_sp.AAC.1
MHRHVADVVIKSTRPEGVAGPTAKWRRVSCLANTYYVVYILRSIWRVPGVVSASLPLLAQVDP